MSLKISRFNLTVNQFRFDCRRHAVNGPTLLMTHQDANLAFLRRHGRSAAASLPEVRHLGSIRIKTDKFDGHIHWHGQPGKALYIDAPGDGSDSDQQLAIDVPGHCVSTAWSNDKSAKWPALFDAAANVLHALSVVDPPLPQDDPERQDPDLSPDRRDSQLTTTMGIAHARHFFAPSYETNGAHAISVDSARINPAALAKEHRVLIRSVCAKALHRTWANG